MEEKGKASTQEKSKQRNKENHRSDDLNDANFTSQLLSETNEDGFAKSDSNTGESTDDDFEDEDVTKEVKEKIPKKGTL